MLTPMGRKKNDDPDDGRRVVARNRRARYGFEILERVEAGISLLGTEVKSLREGKASLSEAYARIKGDEIFLIGFHIPEYRAGNVWNHEPTRQRKLLLHRREIDKLSAKVFEKGLTLVPLSVYFNVKGLAKVDLALARGKARHDKRQDLKRSDAKRDIQRQMAKRW
jgi:SsrA-binding protein